jgi:hypothetical protein
MVYLFYSFFIIFCVLAAYFFKKHRELKKVRYFLVFAIFFFIAELSLFLGMVGLNIQMEIIKHGNIFLPFFLLSILTSIGFFILVIRLISTKEPSK